VVKYEIVETTPGHILELSRTMCDEDVEEVWAAGHVVPQKALSIGRARSRDTQTFLANGRVLCIFGVGQIEAFKNVGVPWMLSSGELPKHYWRFARGSAEWMKQQTSKWTEMINYVDARNSRAVRWLAWLGFDIDVPRPYGPDDMPFHRFSWRSPCVSP